MLLVEMLVVEEVGAHIKAVMRIIEGDAYVQIEAFPHLCKLEEQLAFPWSNELKEKFLKVAASAPPPPPPPAAATDPPPAKRQRKSGSAAGGFTLVPAAAAPTPTPPPVTVAEIGARGNLKDIKVLEKLAELIVKPASDYYAKVRPSSLVFFGCFLFILASIGFLFAGNPGRDERAAREAAARAIL